MPYSEDLGEIKKMCAMLDYCKLLKTGGSTKTSELTFLKYNVSCPINQLWDTNLLTGYNTLQREQEKDEIISLRDRNSLRKQSGGHNLNFPKDSGYSFCQLS